MVERVSCVRARQCQPRDAVVDGQRDLSCEHDASLSAAAGDHVLRRSERRPPSDASGAGGCPFRTMKTMHWDDDGRRGSRHRLPPMAKVCFEPIGEEIECGEDETVLDAAFREGYSLVYGCREGQCSACKCFLLEGEVSLKRYSTFALSDAEESSGYTLLCRAMPDTDLTVELLHVQENYRLEHAIKDGTATVVSCEPLTSDIHQLV